MSFHSPLFFLLLLALPLVAWRLFSPRTTGRLPLPWLQARSSLQTAKASLWWLPGLLRLLALVALIVALARPRMPGAEIYEGEGVGIMLALDMSASMIAIDLNASELEETLSRGELPQNRFETAREVLKTFIQERNRVSRDAIGLIIFGEDAWLRYPMTHDHARLIESLDGLVLDSGVRTGSPDCPNQCTISGNGTAIGDALRRSYSQLSRQKDLKSKMIVLITDGKELGGKTTAPAMLRHLKALPEDEQIRVYTFQVGGMGEMYVPSLDRLGRPLLNNQGIPYYEKPRANFDIDPELLKEIAAETHAQYYESYNSEQFRKDIDDLARTAFEDSAERPQVDVFLWPLYLALLLLSVEWLLRFTLFRSLSS